MISHVGLMSLLENGRRLLFTADDGVSDAEEEFDLNKTNIQ